jgi:hypothetical protein
MQRADRDSNHDGDHDTRTMMAPMIISHAFTPDAVHSSNTSFQVCACAPPSGHRVALSNQQPAIAARRR